jgi:hypothetical protein
MTALGHALGGIVEKILSALPAAASTNIATEIPATDRQIFTQLAGQRPDNSVG